MSGRKQEISFERAQRTCQHTDEQLAERKREKESQEEAARKEQEKRNRQRQLEEAAPQLFAAAKIAEHELERLMDVTADVDAAPIQEALDALRAAIAKAEYES